MLYLVLYLLFGAFIALGEYTEDAVRDTVDSMWIYVGIFLGWVPFGILFSLNNIARFIMKKIASKKS